MAVDAQVEAKLEELRLWNNAREVRLVESSRIAEDVLTIVYEIVDDQPSTFKPEGMTRITRRATVIVAGKDSTDLIVWQREILRPPTVVEES